MAKSKRQFGNVRKLPSGRFQARYTAPDGSYITAPQTFAAKIHAETWIGDRAREIDAGAWIPQAVAERRRKRATFKAYAESWLETRQVGGRPLKARTKALYGGFLKRELIPAFGTSDLAAIKADDVRKWYAKMLVDRPTTRAHTYALLKAILTTAMDEEYIEANPCRIRGAGGTKAVHKVTPASVTEIETITAKMPEQLQLAVTCASWLAMRLGETLELRRGDIDLDSDSGVVRVRRALVRVGGKLQADTPKSTAGVRDIAIPPHLVPQFEDHLSNYVGPDGDALLFPSSADPTRWHQAKRLYEHYHQARAAAGRDKLRWHDLRHSGAVLAALSGASLAELMSRLGHSTPHAALRYQHVASGRDAAVAAAMSKLAACSPTEPEAASGA
jgi:integrase